MDLTELKKRWVGFQFDTTEFTASGEEMLGFAVAVGETEPRFTDPSDPDFQAAPTFTTKFVSRRVLPEGFAHSGARGFDAGKAVTAHAPVRAGDVLTAQSQIADIYEKTGRSGPMLFIVHRMEFRNQAGELLSVVDWRMVRQMDPE